MEIIKEGGLHRKQAVGMPELIDMYIRSMKIEAGLNTQRVFAAWDEASGASASTIRKFYRGGTLYVTLSSSMVRSGLDIRKEVIRLKMNDLLSKDELFVKDYEKVSYVQNIVLK